VIDSRVLGLSSCRHAEETDFESILDGTGLLQIIKPCARLICIAFCSTLIPHRQPACALTSDDVPVRGTCSRHEESEGTPRRRRKSRAPPPLGSLAARSPHRIWPYLLYSLPPFSSQARVLTQLALLCTDAAVALIILIDHGHGLCG
jgi:hypothetical protein